MKFSTTTAAPQVISTSPDKQAKIKSLVFQAVELFIEDNETGRQELLEMLAPSGSEQAAS